MASALLTGASGVIGSAMLKTLHAEQEHEGLQWLLPVRSPQKLESCLEPGFFASKKACVCTLDLGDLSQVQAFCDTLLPAHGPYHSVALVAGTSQDASSLRLEAHQFQKILDINLNSTALILSSLMGRKLLAPGASVLLVGSMSGLSGNQGQAAYAASKGALVDLLRSSSMSCGRMAVRLNLLMPPLVESPLWQGLNAKARQSLFAQRLLADPHPEKTCADSASFLLSQRSRYIHGQIWHADSRISGLPWE
jgi:3-oxoacyl-[acyl-carrier protein] reductase